MHESQSARRHVQRGAGGPWPLAHSENSKTKERAAPRDTRTGAVSSSLLLSLVLSGLVWMNTCARAQTIDRAAAGAEASFDERRTQRARACAARERKAVGAGPRAHPERASARHSGRAWSARLQHGTAGRVAGVWTAPSSTQGSCPPPPPPPAPPLLARLSTLGPKRIPGSVLSLPGSGRWRWRRSPSAASCALSAASASMRCLICSSHRC
mmetsp:Transcript_9783/g.29103  ORF Transcript_9783/g.29103 Transcript_9783/m.29103 type:complete len:211 (-) Transcript_9783:254-886(-)